MKNAGRKAVNKSTPGFMKATIFSACSSFIDTRATNTANIPTCSK